MLKQGKQVLFNGILLNKRVGWSNFLILLLNITDWACLLNQGQKSFSIGKPDWLLHLGLDLT